MTRDLAALFARATASHEAGRWEEAERGYRAVLAADAGHADALHQLGLLACQNGKADLAIELIGRALALAPDRGAYHNTLGGALLDAGRVAEAIAAFEAALKLTPASIEVRNNLANALHAGGRLDEAISIYRAILAQAPADADVAHNLGRALEAAGRAGEAIACYRAALAVRPGDALVLGHLGNALCAAGAWDEALVACEEAMRLAPESPVVLTSYGNALMGQGRFAEAIGAYEKAIALAPNLPELRVNLGMAHHGAGDWSAAAACFEAVLASGADERARLALARSYIHLGRREEAAALFRRVLEIDPGNVEARLELGLALNDLGRHAEGLSEIGKGPGLVHLSLASGTASAAERRAPPPGPPPHFIGGWFLEDRGLCERLIALFENMPSRHLQGRTSRGVDLAIKRATDFVIFPRDLEGPGYEPVAAYLRELEACAGDYARQWPHLAEILSGVDLVPFQIQRYRPGEHFQAPHSERMTFGLMHRVLAWMTYLNDVPEGGATRFHHFDIDVQPERGKTLIWPAEWTHMHAGQVVTHGTKYIITGWMHFPAPAA